MEYLKDIFSDKALTFEEFTEAVNKSEKIKLANLNSGEYVSIGKFKDKETELNTANQAIKDLQETVKKFDGVDVEKLKNDLAEAETKYKTDIKNLKIEIASEKFVDSLKPKDNLSRNATLAEFAKQNFEFDGEAFKGAKEWAEQFKKDNHAHFSDEEQNEPTSVVSGLEHKEVQKKEPKNLEEALREKIET